MRGPAAAFLLAAFGLAAFAPGCYAGDGSGAAGADGGMEIDANAEPPLPRTGAEIYPPDRTLSPLTPRVASNLRAIAGRGSLQGDVFAKVGASATVSAHFMHCFAGSDVDLGGRGELSATVEHFLGGDAGGEDPYQRESLSATVGWSAGAAISGDPSPLEQEVGAIAPRFAVIMYGTNDIQLGDIDRYAENMFEIADRLTAQGVIPAFTTIMPRDDSAEADAEVPRYNLVVRGVAQSRMVPLMDLHRELLQLEDHGLAGDGIHPSVFRDGGARACAFTEEGLTHGYNLRNLLTIQTLDRLRRTVIEGNAALDSPAGEIAGSGAADDPFVIEALPFVHVADTRQSGGRDIDVYGGCDAPQDESGAEHFYRLEVAEPIRIRAFVVDRGESDIDVHLLDGAMDGDACIERAHREIAAELEPGTYYLSLDSFTSDGQPLEGEYLLAVRREPLTLGLLSRGGDRRTDSRRGARPSAVRRRPAPRASPPRRLPRGR